MRSIILFLLIPAISFGQSFSEREITRYNAESEKVTIIRDTWGIPHIYGKTDADAVFGLMYSQCEENFSRIERNYLEIMGRLSEIEGRDQLYSDLEMRLIYDSTAAKLDYLKSPAWFKKLLNAFADGINYYLYKHPDVHPLLLKHFEAWFPLMYTDGSIDPTQEGGLTLNDIKSLYGNDRSIGFIENKIPFLDYDPSGSNGFALAPSKTLSGKTILYINPHVTFYFRSEVQMVSEEGLNVYGAVTWGQFFVYQGFNQYCGWMHTSSYADVADLFIEKIIHKNDKLYYEYDGKLIPLQEKNVVINYKNGAKVLPQRFTTYSTLHGPMVGMREGKWLSLKENNRSLSALLQSWLITKTKGFEEFKQVMNLRSNNSNNTVFADYKGNIAYWHGNFMPKRDPHYNYSMPVDGSFSATNWQGIHRLDEIVHIYNPASGWIENCNSTPFTASGSSSPKKEDYPAYMAPDGQNPRAINAIRLLSKASNMTIDRMIQEIGYNKYLSAFDILLPALFKAYDKLSDKDSLKSLLKEPVFYLKNWDKYSSASSIASSIAIEWAYKLAPMIPPVKNPYQSSDIIGQLNEMASLNDHDKLNILNTTILDLEKRFSSWKIPWGTINRYQRLGPGEEFNDKDSSLSVGLAAATWGSIPSFASRRFANTDKRYGLSGNSFIACVEFGSKVKAKTIITGGQSFDPASKHFIDQAEMYLEGNFKDVYFYKKDVLKHVEKKYHPGG